MIFAFRRKKTRYAGLAIHHDRLSLVKLCRVKNQILMEGVASVTYKTELIPDEKIHSSVELLNVLRQLILTSGAEDCHGALSLPATQVIHKRIRVPAYLNHNERVTEIRTNLNYYLPGINDPLNFDFFPLEQKDQDTELQLIAARREQMDTWLQLTHEAGLKINVVDVDMYAIARALCEIDTYLLKQTCVILDGDKSAAQLILLKQGKVISVCPIVMDSEDNVIEQIKRSIHLFSASDPFVSLEKMVLTGFSEDKHQLELLLKSRLNLPVTLIEHASLVAYGLALRGFSA